MKRSLALVAALVAAALAIACGGQAPAGAGRPGQAAGAGGAEAEARGLVFLPGASAIKVVDGASGRVRGTLPAGTPSPDWRRLYVLRDGTLDQLDTATGRAVESQPVPGWVRAVRTSANGRWLAFAGDGAPSRFQVQDAMRADRPTTVELPGTFTFDGLSNDGRRLYLLQWMEPGRYQIRMFDLSSGRLDPAVIADKREVGELMSGEALTSLTTRGGAMQLTLYQRSAADQAFVHALPIGEPQPFAFCEDLPAPAAGWGFVAGPDGQRFYAVNPAAGWVVELRAGSAADEPRVRTGRIDPQPGAPAGVTPAAAVSPDGATLFLSAASGLVRVDTSTLQATGRVPAGGPVAAIAFASDGSALYAMDTAASVTRIDLGR
jgi:hypothetical protein